MTARLQRPDSTFGMGCPRRGRGVRTASRPPAACGHSRLPRGSPARRGQGRCRRPRRRPCWNTSLSAARRRASSRARCSGRHRLAPSSQTEPDRRRPVGVCERERAVDDVVNFEEWPARDRQRVPAARVCGHDEPSGRHRRSASRLQTGVAESPSTSAISPGILWCRSRGGRRRRPSD